MDRVEILKRLAELAEYIRGCERNAAEGSKARERFAAWLSTVNAARAQILSWMDGEDG